METRMDYARKLALKLMEWDAVIDGLREKAELAADLHKKAGYEKRIAWLKEQRRDGSELLRRVHEADDAQIEEVKGEVDYLIGGSGEVYKKAA